MSEQMKGGGVKARYHNPWHSTRNSLYGPAEYETDVRPTDYGGYLIYQRLPGCFDVVKDGVCITQRAGIRGAHDEINRLAANSTT